MISVFEIICRGAAACFCRGLQGGVFSYQAALFHCFHALLYALFSSAGLLIFADNLRYEGCFLKPGQESR